MSEEDGDEKKVTKREEEENMCPNETVEKTTPVRKARGQSKAGQKLFSSGADATKMKGTGETCQTLSNVLVLHHTLYFSLTNCYKQI